MYKDFILNGDKRIYKKSIAEKMGFDVIEVFSDQIGEFSIEDFLKKFFL